jgi:PhzF family phenazine biosynthesis protein
MKETNGVICLQIDAFTDRPFAGNPAAVCLLDDERDAAWMQAVAAEMNLSETAFVRPLDKGFELRWFTPTVEVELCGHATLASAHTLWSENVVEPDSEIQFHSKSGELTCTRRDNYIELDFPATPVTPAELSGDLFDALGIEPSWQGKSQFDDLVLLQSEDALRALRPNFQSLCALPSRGVIVTSTSNNPRFDFVSRFFAPNAGVDEDPVTGSAHCALGPFWSERLGKAEMTAYQASARGGIVRVRVDGDRVFLVGQAVTVLKGVLVDAAPG